MEIVLGLSSNLILIFLLQNLKMRWNEYAV